MYRYMPSKQEDLLRIGCSYIDCIGTACFGSTVDCILSACFGLALDCIQPITPCSTGLMVFYADPYSGIVK